MELCEEDCEMEPVEETKKEDSQEEEEWIKELEKYDDSVEEDEEDEEWLQRLYDEE